MANYYRVPKSGVVLPVAETDITFFDITITFDSVEVDEFGAGDVVHLVGPFPAGAKVVLDVPTTPDASSAWSILATGGDSNATPTLDLNLATATTLAGGTLDEFINSLTLETLDHNAATENGTDLGGKYLVLDVDAVAATAADLVVRVRGAFSIQPTRIYIDASDAVAVAI